MSAKYTIERYQDLEGDYAFVDRYHVVNPSGVPIASRCSWRVARKIADLYNADVEWRRHKTAIWSELNDAIERGAVSLQEEA